MLHVFHFYNVTDLTVHFIHIYKIAFKIVLLIDQAVKVDFRERKQKRE